MSILSSLPSLVAKAKAIGSSARGTYRAIKGSKAAGVAAKALPGVGVLGAGMGAGSLLTSAFSGEGRKRYRSRGITARDFRTTRRTMKKILKMYAKLPKRPSSRGERSTRGNGTHIVNVE